MNIQQLTAKYGKGKATQTGVAGLKAKYANGAGLKRWEASQATAKPTVAPTPTTAPISTQPNLFQKAKTTVSNILKPRTPVVSTPVNPLAPATLGVGGNTPQISAAMTATPKQDKIMKETVKFGAKTAVGFADLMTESLDYVVDYAAHNLIDKKKPQWKFLADANDKWTKFYDEQSAAGNIPTQKLKKYVDTLQNTNFIKNDPLWEKATIKEKLSSRLGETILNLSPSVLSSAAAFIINPGLGFFVSATSTANDVKDTAIEYGVEPDKAEKLGLATGLLVGALDKIVPDEVMSGEIKKKFIGSFAKRLLAWSIKTAKITATEASTEILQEDIQMLAEATFRNDMSWDEANTRQAMAGLGGLIGGAGFSMIGNFSDNTINKDILGRPDNTETTTVTSGVEVEEKPIDVNPVVEEKPVEKVVEKPTAESLIKEKGYEPASVDIKDNENFIVENLDGKPAKLMEIPLSEFGKPKFETATNYKYEPGRKITSPIEVTIWEGKLKITDGANRFEQAYNNKDKTILAVVENYEQYKPVEEKAQKTEKQPVEKPVTTKSAAEQENLPYTERTYYRGLQGKAAEEYQKTGILPKAKQAFGGEYSITSDYETAKQYAGEKGIVVEIKIDKNAGVSEADPFDKRSLRDNWNDLQDIGEGEMIVNNSKVIKVVNKPKVAEKKKVTSPKAAEQTKKEGVVETPTQPIKTGTIKSPSITSNRPDLTNETLNKGFGEIDDLHTIDPKTGKLISKSDVPIKTGGENLNPQNILKKIDSGTNGLPGAELKQEELTSLGNWLKSNGDTSLRGKIIQGPNGTKDVVFGTIKDRGFKGQTEYLLMADSGPYKGAFRLSSTPINSKFFDTKIVGEIDKSQPIKTGGDEKQAQKPKELTLAPSKATTEKKVLKEASKAGVLNAINLGKGTYNKPKIGVTEIKTLLSHPEFKANPVMTFNENGTLTYKGKKVEMTIYPQALNINTDKLVAGDTIRIDIEAFKKTKGVKQTRIYKGNEVLGFNPKTIIENPYSPEAKLEMDKIIRQQDIAEMLTKKLGVPLRRGKFRHAGAIGLYKPKQKVSRYKSGGFPTVAHEAAGHYLDDMFGFSNNINIEERRKLMAEYGYSYEGQPHKQRKEAFAEFMRFMLTGQEAKAETFAPKFHEEYITKINKMPEIKAVLDEAAHQYKLYSEQPAVAKIASMLAVGKEKKPGFFQSFKQNISDKYTQVLDELHPLSEFTELYKKYVNKELPGNLNPYVLARTFKGWQSKANLFLNRGTFGKTFWTRNVKTGKAEMKFKGKSYSEIMKPIEQSGALNEFRVYIVAQRVVNDLAPRGKRSGIELKDAQQALDELNKSHPEFEKIAEERRKYKDELLEFAAENGLISQEQLMKIKELNKFHVPFYRVMEESSSGFMGKRKIAGNMGSPIKSFKGSDRLIIDPFESDIKDTYAIINAAERNNIGIAMANLANKHYELGRLFEKVDAPMKATTVNVKEVLVKALEGTETTVDDIPEDLEDVMVTLFRPTQDRGANMLNVNIGDKKLVYQVDPDLFKAIQGLNAEDVNAIVKLMSLPAKALRLGATLSPDFAVRNPFRDLFSAFVYSNYGFTPGVDFIKGVFEIMKKGDVYNLWVAGGGENSMMVSMDRGNLQKNFKEMMKTTKDEVLEYAKNPVKFLRIVSELGEAGTRIGEMKRAINAGTDPITGAFASREVTLDFARIGAKTKAINMITAFFNANLQGTDKMIRSFRKAPVRSLLKSVIGITLPSILLYLANHDDKRWKEIPRWQKDLSWIILTKNHVWRIPKPFELGIIFGSVPERILEYMETQDPQVFTQLKKSIMDGFTPGFIPTGFLPLWENISNYSFFREQPIVSEGMSNLPPEEQSSRYTSEVAKIIGNILGYSPLKIDNLIQGYTGGLGKYTVSFIDTILTGTGIVPSDIAPPAKSLEDTSVVKAFMVRNPVGSASESVNRIYVEFEKTNARMTQAKKLLKEGEIEKFNAYVKKYPEIIDAIPLQSVITNFTELNKVANLIRESKTLSPEEKRDKLLKIDEFKTEMARTTLDQIDKDRKERNKKTSLKLVKPAYAIEDKTITPTPAGKKTTYAMTNADGEQISVTPRNNKITEKVLRDNQELVDIIVKAASDFDIDPGLMLDMAYSESTFRANPPLNDNSPTQVVKGLFQWKEESWKMAKKALNDNIGDDRTDAKDNAIATAWALSTGKIRWWEANGNHIKWSKNYTTKELKKYGWRL